MKLYSHISNFNGVIHFQNDLHLFVFPDIYLYQNIILYLYIPYIKYIYNS